MRQIRWLSPDSALLGWSLAGLVLGSWLHWGAASSAASHVWTIAVLPVLAALVIEILRSLVRGDVGLDIVAALSMTVALLFGENLAAAVVAVMYSGGTFLEAMAERRARKEMHALLSRVPRSALRHEGDAIHEIALDLIEPGDRLLIRQGDILPVDGRVGSENAYLDRSALTGEPLPEHLFAGDEALSGSVNAGEAFDLIATHRASESTYAGIVRLVEEAQRSRAPVSRLADRLSLWFLMVAVGLALAAWWFSGDPIRAVAVLVVATPCPLILAVPVALVAGMSRAAHYGILIKGAGPLETMSRIGTLILDKTGTLSRGEPEIVSIQSLNGLDQDELLRLAASLEQATRHPIAQAIVQAARGRGLRLSVPFAITELPGEGLTGTVDGHSVVVGGLDFVANHLDSARDDAVGSIAPGAVLVSVAVDGVAAGRMVMADPLRPDAAAMIAALRDQGVTRLLLATGDRAEVARYLVEGLGFDEIHAGLSPGDKVALVHASRGNGPVMMVGDGLNDAPALAAADLGVAMGARGAAASSEAADVVLLVDRIDRLGQGITIARRAMDIAWQSVVVGIGLSVLGMIAAAFGYLTPVQGALLQELIDVAVILNALRALGIAPDARPPAQRSAPNGTLRGSSAQGQG